MTARAHRQLQLTLYLSLPVTSYYYLQGCAMVGDASARALSTGVCAGTLATVSFQCCARLGACSLLLSTHYYLPTTTYLLTTHYLLSDGDNELPVLRPLY